MEITVYVSDNFSSTYLPFLLYRKAISLILLKNNIANSVQVIDNVNMLKKTDEKQIIIMNFYCLNNAANSGNLSIFNFLETLNAHIILINTEFINWGGYNLRQYFETINNIKNSESTFYVFEYNITNYKYIKDTHSNINAIFIPFLYHESSEQFYLKNINEKISWNNKDIDVLFYGSLNNRRQHILNQLMASHPDKKIVHFHSCDNEKLCNLIEKSKIILNIMFYDNNVIFDYYRNSFLIANKCLLISESPSNINEILEPGLANVKDYVIFSDYNNFVEIVGSYLTKSEDEISDIIEKQYNWFKTHNSMEEVLMNKIKTKELLI